MNYKDTFINFEAMQKGMEDTLNPPPDISSIIWKNLKNGLSERGIEPKDIEGMNKNEAKNFIRDRIYQDGLKQSVDEGKEEDPNDKIDYKIIGVLTPTSTPSTNIESFTNIPLKQQFSFTKLKRNIENFGDIYDKRTNGYENCEGVGKIIDEIRTRKANNEECNNEDCWKASPLVKQEHCVPIYEWDGKFYKDKASAQGIITKKSGTPLNNMTEAECKTYGESIGMWKNAGSYSWAMSGCIVNTLDDIYYNKHSNTKNCAQGGGYYCIEKIKYGTNDEKIMKPAQGGTRANGAATSATSQKEPGEYVHKTGKFLMSSVYNEKKWSTPSLDGTYGWLARRDRRNSPGWIRMETVSGNIESVKGVVTKGYSHTFHTTKFKVYVSRNGDSWKQMKDSSGNYEFTGGVAQKTNYFKDGPVEAKYIKFYPTAGGYYKTFNAGYVKDLSGTVKCKGESGLLKTVVGADKPWFRFTFNETKTRSPELGGKYSEGTAASTKQCPPNGSVLVAQKGEIIGGPNNIPVSDLKLLKNGTVWGLKGEMSKEKLPGCGPDATSPGWRSSASGASFKWSACVKPDANGLRSSFPSNNKGDAFNSSDGGYQYMFRHWNGSDNNGYNRINNATSYKDNTQISDANNGSFYTKIPTKFKVQNYNDVNVIRQPCNRGTDYSNPTYLYKFYGEFDGSTHSGGASKTYCAGGFKGTTGSIWKCINVNKDAVEGWSGNGKKKTWGTFSAPGYIANYVRDGLKSKFGSTNRNDLLFFKWGLKTVHPDCDKAGTSAPWDRSWDCGGSHGKANMTNTGNRGFIGADINRWGAPSTNKMKFKLGSTQVVKGIYYKQGHVWGNNTKNLPRYWKIKVGSTKVKNANGDDEWALPETDDNQYILFDPNKEYSGSSVTLYDISYGSSGLISFKASFFVKDTSKYSVWGNTSKGCTTTIEKKCICDNGTGAIGSACPENKHKYCSSCNNGYYLNGSKCSLKKCTCSNGTGASGTNCPTNSSEKCTSCNANYGLSSNKCHVCSATQYSPSGTGTCTELSRCHNKNWNGSGQNLNSKYSSGNGGAFQHHPYGCLGVNRGGQAGGYCNPFKTPRCDSEYWDCYNHCRKDRFCKYFQITGGKCHKYTKSCLQTADSYYTFKMKC